MDRLRIAFAAVVVASLGLGGTTVAQFHSYLGSVSTVDVVEPQLSAEVVDADLRDDRFVATVRLENPTGVDLEVKSAKLRVHNRTEQRLASGAGRRLDGNGSTLPARGTLTATYEIRLSPEQQEALRSALQRDARLSMSVGLQQGDVQFSFAASDMDLVEE